MDAIELNIPATNQQRIVIIGGGFAGLNLAKSLKNSNYQTVLIDRHNYHTFQPLLYQVATAGLEPDSIAYPLRKVFNHYENFFFRIAEVEAVVAEDKSIVTDKGVLKYDYLVLATGAHTNYFGNENIERYSMPMKSVREALDLRSLILQNFEEALITKDLVERQKLMNLVVVGGGPTGVELAGALAELKKWILPKDYPDLDFRQMKVHLMEGQDRLLGSMSNASSDKAKEFLHKMGVEIWTDTFVKDYDGETVTTNKGKDLPTKTLIWAAGVKGNPLFGLETNKDGRIPVDGYLQSVEYSDVFVIGDLAMVKSEDTKEGYPMLASVASQQGHHLAKSFKKLLANKPIKEFKYKDKEPWQRLEETVRWSICQG
jgi:NADH dehydrogenase